MNPDGDLADFQSKFNPPFTVGMAGGLNALEYMQWPKDQRPLVPIMAFIDRQGIIQAQYSGLDTNFFDDDMEKHIRAEVEKLLAAKPPPAAKTKAKPAAKKTNN